MILCGIDFSPSSQAALTAAAALARKQDTELLLVTVLKQEGFAARHEAEQQLAQEAAELRRVFQIAVDTCVLHGLPEEQLLSVATKRHAQLLVVGATTTVGQLQNVGVVAERLCQRAVVPVLIVREAASFLAWNGGQRALRAVMGSGLGDASKSALACVGAWPDVALTVLHVAWPYGEHYRLGVQGRLPRDHLLPEVEQQLLGDLGRWATAVVCRMTPKLRVIAGWGRVDFHLEQSAQGNDADLVVVGTHERNLHDPIWQSSVSRSAIHGTSRNVLCVPERYLAPRSASAPRVIVVPTDFTALADRAIPFAASLLDRGGALHLVHVALELPEGAQAALTSELSRRVPKDLQARGVASELRVLQGNPAWLTISQHAARAHADLICMATHSRDAGRGFVLGSQTKALLQHAQIPVLLVPQDRES